MRAVFRPIVLFQQRAASSHAGTVALAYNRVGDASPAKGTPLVIGHGLFGQKQNWNSVSKALHKKLNAPVYVVDHRNHGESPRWFPTKLCASSSSRTSPSTPENRNHFKWKVNLDAIGGFLEHVIHFRIKDGIFRGPSILIHGENSDFVREDDKPEIKAFFPNIRFHPIARAGHWGPRREPGRLRRRVRRVLVRMSSK
ncbi:Family S33 non-peptidase-like proteinue [Aphelenchoides fujianensis]|nr:Family S33 non-peptidase-like proteinue [Aphelenchoides fujianensis]